MKTPKNAASDTLIRRVRGAGADARARWEGKETAALTRSKSTSKPGRKGREIGPGPTLTGAGTRSSAVPRLFRARNVQNYFGQP